MNDQPHLLVSSLKRYSGNENDIAGPLFTLKILLGVDGVRSIADLDDSELRCEFLLMLILIEKIIGINNLDSHLETPYRIWQAEMDPFKAMFKICVF